MNCNTLLLHTPMLSKRCTKEPELTLLTGESCFCRWSRRHNEDVVQARIPPKLHGGSEQCQPSGACFAHFSNSDGNPGLRSRHDSITVPASQCCLYRYYSGMKDWVTEGRSCLHLQLHEASRIVSDTWNTPCFFISLRRNQWRDGWPDMSQISWLQQHFKRIACGHESFTWTSQNWHE
jgi:hypothetical protein